MISQFYKSPPSLPQLKNNTCGLVSNTFHWVTRQFSFNSTWSSFDFDLLWLEKSSYRILYSITSYVDVFNLVTR